MHPAPSIIFFTVASGMGFGLLFFLGLDPTPPTGWIAFTFWAIAYALAVGGLVSSTFHLGNPQRALRAFTQWRTSWLSREGWLSVATLTVMGLYGLGLVFFGTAWQPLGWLGAILSLGTVYATSMIYGQLKTVPRWNQSLTPWHFMAYALAGGALLSGNVTLGLVGIVAASGLQILHWQKGDTAFATSGSTLATATGLKGKALRSFERPHTGTNYLLKEMVHQVGRRHASKLRLVALVLSAVLPAILLLLPFSHVLGALAILSHLAGVLVARWLFFAEAEHVVGLYYGAR